MDSESMGALASLQEALTMAQEELEKAVKKDIKIMTRVDYARHLYDVLFAVSKNPATVKEALERAGAELRLERTQERVAREEVIKAKWTRYNAEYALHMQQACALLIPPGGDLQHQAEPGSALEAFLKWLKHRRPGTCSRGALTVCGFDGNVGFVPAAVGGACQPYLGVACICM